MQTVGSGSCRTVTRVWSSGRKRDEPVELFTRPSRPGRLMEVTACQDLHETPRTRLGLPHRHGPQRAATPPDRPLTPAFGSFPFAALQIRGEPADVTRAQDLQAREFVGLVLFGEARDLGRRAR